MSHGTLLVMTRVTLDMCVSIGWNCCKLCKYWLTLVAYGCLGFLGWKFWLEAALVRSPADGTTWNWKDRRRVNMEKTTGWILMICHRVAGISQIHTHCLKQIATCSRLHTTIQVFSHPTFRRTEPRHFTTLCPTNLVSTAWVFESLNAVKPHGCFCTQWW